MCPGDSKRGARRRMQTQKGAARMKSDSHQGTVSRRERRQRQWARERAEQCPDQHVKHALHRQQQQQSQHASSSWQGLAKVVRHRTVVSRCERQGQGWRIMEFWLGLWQMGLWLGFWLELLNSRALRCKNSHMSDVAPGCIRRHGFKGLAVFRPLCMTCLFVAAVDDVLCCVASSKTSVQHIKKDLL